jgi:hypothetical protein
VSYLGGALKGFQSIAYSGSSPVPWGNIFVNPTSLTSTYGVIGPCGVLDQVMDQVLGPDPTSCADQTGPLPGEGSNTSTPSSSSPASPSSPTTTPTTSSSTGSTGSSQSDGGDLTGPNSGLGALSQLISPLLQGAG